MLEEFACWRRRSPDQEEATEKIVYVPEILFRMITILEALVWMEECARVRVSVFCVIAGQTVLGREEPLGPELQLPRSR